MLPTLFFSRCDHWLQDGTPVVSCVIFTENRRIGTIVGREQGRVPQRRPSRYRFRVGLAESTRPEENHDDRQRHDDAARAVGKEF